MMSHGQLVKFESSHDGIHTFFGNFHRDQTARGQKNDSWSHQKMVRKMSFNLVLNLNIQVNYSDRTFNK